MEGAWLEQLGPGWWETLVDDGLVARTFTSRPEVVFGVDVALRKDSTALVAAARTPDGRTAVAGWCWRAVEEDRSPGAVRHHPPARRAVPLPDQLVELPGATGPDLRPLLADGPWRSAGGDHDPRFFELPARFLGTTASCSSSSRSPLTGWCRPISCCTKLVADRMLVAPKPTVMASHAASARWKESGGAATCRSTCPASTST